MNHHTLIALSLSACASFAHGQGIVINNNDSAGEGFNDATARTSDIDGQPTTLGQDRLDCFAAAAQVWAEYLDMSITVAVDAQFNSLGGNAMGAPLGFAGPNNAYANFTGTPVADMLFTVAEANQYRGLDLSAGAEIGATFNSDVDGPVVLGSVSWYYGIDGNPPGGKIDFFPVALHELGHGLGFLTLMNPSTGALNNGFMDIFTNQLHRAGSTNLDYSAMTNGQRQAANTSGEVVWKGAEVVAEQGGNEPMYAPNPLQSGSSISHWDTTATPNLLMEPSYTESFTALTLETQAFVDMLWPLAADPLDPDNVYVDFSFGGVETGAAANPFNTLAEAVTAANASATINIAPGTTPETFSGGGEITKALTLLRNGISGNVTIGDPGARTNSVTGPRSGFISRR